MRLNSCNHIGQCLGILALGLLISMGVAPARAAPSPQVVEGGSGVLVSVSGVVTNEDGEPLPGVTVSLDGPIRQVVTTDGAGRFRAALPPGRYTARLELEGFAVLERSFTVNVGASAELRLSLEGPADDWEEPRASPPPPVLRPAEWAVPPPARRPIDGIFWNGWLAERDEPPRPVTRFEPGGESYAVIFDLSPYRYDEQAETLALTVMPDQELREVLRGTTRDVLTLRTYPVVGGRGLRLYRQVTPDLHVDLKKLRDPEPGRREGETSRDFFHRTKAARVAVEVELEPNGGCAWVALSIWTDGRNSKPLDHVVRHIAVPNADGVLPQCGSQPNGADVLEAGLDRLLRTETGASVDAALHVFDVGVSGGSGGSAAVMMTDGGPLAWQTQSSLNWLIRDEQGLKRELEAARQKKGYARAIQRLTTTIFPNDSRAKKALRTLQGLASQKPRAVVLARLVAGGRTQPLPLGLLDDGSGRPLGQSVDFVVPMPADSKPTGVTCVNHWTQVLPSVLRSAGEIPCSAMGSADVIDDWSAFENFLGTDTAPTSPEGLLLLAHQAGGSLSFGADAAAERALPSDLARSFSSGSVAVLLACNVGAPGTGDLSWLAAFNSKHIDAAIVSSFAIQQSVGACFARHLSEQLTTLSSSSGASLPFRELFRRTQLAVEKDLDSSPVSRGYIPALYELILVGDPNVSICL